MAGSVTPRFNFTAPNPNALDPSMLEQLYAGGAARRMGPGFNLVAADFARQDREADSNTYLSALEKVNNQVMDSGNRVLEFDDRHAKIDAGIKLLTTPNGGQFATTPAGQYAANLGGPTLNAEQLNALVQIAVQNQQANRYKDIGAGAASFNDAGLGMRPGQTADQGAANLLLPVTPTKIRTATAGNANTGVKPQYERIVKDGQMSEHYRMPLDWSDPNLGPRTPGQLAADRQEQYDQSKFVAALKEAGVNVTSSSKFVTRDTTNSATGKTTPNMRQLHLPDGTVWGYVGEKATIIKHPKGAAR